MATNRIKYSAPEFTVSGGPANIHNVAKNLFRIEDKIMILISLNQHTLYNQSTHTSVLCTETLAHQSRSQA